MQLNRDNDFESLEQWRDKVMGFARANYMRDSVLESMLVVLIKNEENDYESVPVELPIGDLPLIQKMLAELPKEPTIIGYIILGEAKVHIAKPDEDARELYKSVGEDISKLKDTKEAVLFLYEDKLVTKISMYEVIKSGKDIVISNKPLKLPETMTFSELTGYLNVEEKAKQDARETTNNG